MLDEGGVAAAGAYLRHGLLVLDDAGSKSHVYFNGAGLVDRFGNAWTQNGTVPQVPRSGRTPAGAGPYTAATNYYSLASPNPLQFTGDFSVAIVMSLNSTAGLGRLVDVGNDTSTAWSLFVNAGSAYMQYNGTTAVGTVSAALSTGVVNVLCGGRSGTTGSLKVNLGAFNTQAGVGTTAGSNSAILGVASSTSGFVQPLQGALYEVWASTTTPSDALFTAIMQRVKARLGITAW